MSGGPSVVPGQRVTAATHNQNVAGPWQALTLQNGWSNSGGAAVAQYRLLNTVTSEVIGRITSGTVTPGTTIFTLPSGYYNPNTEVGLLMFVWTTSVSQIGWALQTTSGAINVESATTATPYWLHAFLSIDA
jgi:hypothetical protein